MRNITETVVVGGGFYGTYIASLLAQAGKKVTLVEKNSHLFQEASYINQARVHRGYHYPRSLRTAFRSQINFQKFVNEFKNAIDDRFLMLYAIAKTGSHINPRQFEEVCRSIGAPFKPARAQYQKLFAKDRIEQIYEAEEFAFNSRVLESTARQKLEDHQIDCLFENEVVQIESTQKSDAVPFAHQNFSAKSAPLKLTLRKISPKKNQSPDFTKGSTNSINSESEFYCSEIYLATYAHLNKILENSSVPLLPIKKEWVEMAFITPPPEFDQLGVTIMDGPFFSIMPFPADNTYSFYHVRYSPHFHWIEQNGQKEKSVLDPAQHKTNFSFMALDAERYMPCIKRAQYSHSRWVERSVLIQSEKDDSRPIFCKKIAELPGVTAILGGKIDNIFDLKDWFQEENLWAPEITKTPEKGMMGNP